MGDEGQEGLPAEPTSRAVRVNRDAWELVSHKHVREHDELLAEAHDDQTLTAYEVDTLGPLLAEGPRVVHLQSGHGLDDIALVRRGARHVLGVDYSTVAATAAARRARELGVPCDYVVAELPPTPLRSGCAELVYTGKGALIWMPDLSAWAEEVARLLTPQGHLFVHEAHPMVPLYDWDPEVARLRSDRGYFEWSHVNDTYPAHGATEWQWTLGAIVTAVAAAGMIISSLAEHPLPFWRPGDVDAAVWRGQLPNTFSLLARRP